MSFFFVSLEQRLPLFLSSLCFFIGIIAKSSVLMESTCRSFVHVQSSCPCIVSFLVLLFSLLDDLSPPPLSLGRYL